MKNQHYYKMSNMINDLYLNISNHYIYTIVLGSFS